ncbi:hypothetical protein C8R46DRAFT_969387 [Mycena filopes]|nr:hypothetical protein C8R46DRAFT_969387 [Mycena filopes]
MSSENPSGGVKDTVVDAVKQPVAVKPLDKHNIDHHLEALREALDVPVSPYTGGIHPVRAEDPVIYYDGEEESSASRINLGNAKDAALIALAAACDPATFGVNNKDVLDESYRKAGKMDLSKFASRLDVVASGLIDAISPDILQGQAIDDDETLRAELYKLNVYGPGSFFKAHQDTPRGENMIGSLVIVFPTSHTGGELILEHDGTSWTFDSAAELAAAQGPALAYVAFYSDVTHAVQEVTQGYRVTLTYNLFLVDRTAPVAPGTRIIPAAERALEDPLRALLADPSFLPDGGFLAYGLDYQYPMPAPPNGWASPTRLGPILRLLKGSDVRTVSERVGLITHLKVLYDSGENYGEKGKDVLADDVLDMSDMNEDNHMVLHEEIEGRGVVVQRSAERLQQLRASRRYQYDDDEEDGEWGVEIQWVTEINETNNVSSQYLAYGNEASIEHIYGNAALFVEVPPAGRGIRT